MSHLSSRGPTDFELRRARPEDAPCLGVLGAQVYLDTYATEGVCPAIANGVLRSFSTAAMFEVLEQPSIVIHVAELNEHLVGFAQTALDAKQSLVKTARAAELDRLYVQERFTGQGLGGRLLNTAEVEAARHGMSGLWLTVWIYNLRALGFYEKHGYTDLGIAWFEMDGERHENRVLFKSLEVATPP